MLKNILKNNLWAGSGKTRVIGAKISFLIFFLNTMLITGFIHESLSFG